MNQNRKEELLTRWMDGALTDEERREFAPYLEAHPELEREREEYLEMRRALQAAVPADVEPPYPDFFNAHLERKIKDSMLTGNRQSEKSTGFSRLWTWWLAPAAAAALVLAFLAGMKLPRTNVPPVVGATMAPEATALFSPMENVEVKAVVDNDLNATVIVLSGLEEIPDQDLVGWEPPSTKTSGFLVTADRDSIF